ncbi:MAG: ABC transporter ATP-binding protein [Burkholderiales bacterium]
MLRCDGLTLAVPGRVLCRQLSAAFEAGEVWAVLGRNGTGKSTLIHALAGLASPAAGRVEFDGHPLAAMRPRNRAREIGVLLQLEEGTFWGTVAEYVLLGRYAHVNPWSGYSAEDAACAHAALDAFGMSAFARQPFSTLSGGERQRARLAQVLAQSPRVFLLDEPLQHLDLAHQAQVVKLLGARAREKHETVIMVMHEPLWIGRSCTHALVLSGDGSAAAGPSGEILTLDRLERAYGCRLREVPHGEGRSFVPDI